MTVEQLAKIDPREVFGSINEDTFVDTDEWLMMREREWISRIVLDPGTPVPEEE